MAAEAKTALEAFENREHETVPPVCDAWDGEDDDYYTSFLNEEGAVEDPNDASHEGSAAQAVDSALQQVAEANHS